MSFDSSFFERGRLYAIGDIHGRSDLLDRIISAIQVDMKANPVAESLTITVGDYIDRGPDSRGVIARLLQNPFPGAFIPLKGNHELMLEWFLQDPSTGRQWRALGGWETLASYRVRMGSLMMGDKYEAAAQALNAAIPQEHLDFIASLKTSLAVGRYFFCHAGVRPGVPLERQSLEDLLWIREPFLTSQADFGKVVVHGHTPAAAPEVLPNRINIDTGAYATSRLTCVALDGADGVRFLSSAS